MSADIAALLARAHDAALADLVEVATTDSDRRAGAVLGIGRHGRVSDERAVLLAERDDALRKLARAAAPGLSTGRQAREMRHGCSGTALADGRGQQCRAADAASDFQYRPASAEHTPSPAHSLAALESRYPSGSRSVGTSVLRPKVCKGLDCSHSAGRPGRPVCAESGPHSLLGVVDQLAGDRRRFTWHLRGEHQFPLPSHPSLDQEPKLPWLVRNDWRNLTRHRGHPGWAHIVLASMIVAPLTGLLSNAWVRRTVIVVLPAPAARVSTTSKR